MQTLLRAPPAGHTAFYLFNKFENWDKGQAQSDNLNPNSNSNPNVNSYP